MNKLAFALAMAFGCHSVAQTPPPVFVQTVCLKVEPGKTAAYEAFVRDTVTKGMRAMVQSGEIAWFVFSRSVIPAGETATCDYVGATATRGFPSEPIQGRLAQAIAKAGINMTADQYLAKVNSLRRQVTSSMLVTLAAVGEIGEGDYYRVNYMKLKSGGGWNELEQKIWKPVQEQRVKEGKLKAWRTYTRMLPGGSGLPYDAVTIDVFPSWAAQGQAAGLADLIKKVHPTMQQQEFAQKTAAARDLVNAELRRAIIVIGDTKM